jgi:hypothetical protein
MSVNLSAEARKHINNMRTADLLPALKKQMRTATNGAVPKVRLAARHIPSHNKKRSKGSLRSQLASAVSRRIYYDQRSISVVIASVPKGGLSNLARCVEGDIPWQHPFFGHPPEVQQNAKPYFYAALELLAPGFVKQVEKALDDFERML